MSSQLDNHVVLVTGAAGGIGRAIVERLLAAGARVAATDIRQAEPAFRGPAEVLRCSILDVTDEAGWRDTVAAVVGWAGKLTGLVNNAGLLRLGRIADLGGDSLDEQYAINQRGPILGMKYAAAAMRDAGGGSIVNMSSIAGMRGLATGAAYSATKWAVRGVTKVAAIEYGRDNIRVNSIHPGAIATAMIGDIPSDFARAIPLGRVGQPEDVAPLVAFLLSDEASYISGAEISIDGGGRA